MQPTTPYGLNTTFPPYQVPNPVPRVAHPDWLQKRLVERHDMRRQRSVTYHFSAPPAGSSTGETAAESDMEAAAARAVADIEDHGRRRLEKAAVKGPVVTLRRVIKRGKRRQVIQTTVRTEAGLAALGVMDACAGG